MYIKVRKGANIGNRYNQAPHLTQDANGKVTTSHLDITNESQEVCPFPEGDHKASINRRTRKHNKNKMINKTSTAVERSVKYFTGGLKPVSRRANLTFSSDVDQDTLKFDLHALSIPIEHALCTVLLACISRYSDRDLN